MPKIYDENGHKVGSVEESNNGYTIRDEYGWKQGSVEKKANSDDYVVRDKYGSSTGKIEKQFLSEDYNIRDSMGNKTGTVEKSFWSNDKYEIRDKTGRVKGTFKAPEGTSGGMSGGAFLAILVVGILVFFSIDTIPLHLHNMFIPGEPEFIMVTIPLIVDVIAFVITLIRGGFSSFAKDNIFLTIFTECYCGLFIFVGVDIVLLLFIFIASEGSSVLEAIVAAVLGPIMNLTTYIVVLVPAAIVGAILIKVFGEKKV